MAYDVIEETPKTGGFDIIEPVEPTGYDIIKESSTLVPERGTPITDIPPMTQQSPEIQLSPAARSDDVEGIKSVVDPQSAAIRRETFGKSIFGAPSPEELPTGEELSTVTGLPKWATIPASAAFKTVDGLVQYLTSPKGIAETGMAAIPYVGLIQRGKWAVDMAQGAGESSGDLLGRLDKIRTNPHNVSAEDWQGLAEDTFNTAAMLYGAGHITAGELAKIPGSTFKQIAMSKALAREIKKTPLQGVPSVPVVPVKTQFYNPNELRDSLTLKLPGNKANERAIISTTEPIVEPGEGTVEEVTPSPERVTPQTSRPSESIVFKQGGVGKMTTSIYPNVDKIGVGNKGEEVTYFRTDKKDENGRTIFESQPNAEAAKVSGVGEQTKPETPPSPAPTRDQDITRYNEIQKEMMSLGSENMGGEQFQKLWKEQEQIKNRYGGMPPKQEPVSPETKPLAPRQQKLQEKKQQTADATEFNQLFEKHGVDERIAVEKARAEKDAAEAKLIQNKQQQEMVGMGGATPSEFEPVNKFVTSNKNAVVDVEREKRGLPKLMKVARQTFGQVWDDAMARVDHDPELPVRLTKDIAETGRPVGYLDLDTQNAILLHRRIDLRNSLDKALADLKQHSEDGYEIGIEESRQTAARLSDDLAELDAVTKQAGTQLGRGLSIRRMMAKEDFSLAAMEQRMRAAKDGERLTADQQQKIQELHDKIKSQADAYEKHVAELEARIRELEARKSVTELTTDVERQARTQKQRGATRDLNAEKKSIIEGMKDRVIEGDSLHELGGWIQKLARHFVETGARDADELTDKVHDVIKDIVPGVERAETMNAISGYGDFKELSKDEISVELRRMKGELQQLGKIEDMQKGQAPLKTGVERRTPSLLERIRIKQVNDMKRRLGIVVTDPAKQLQSALQSRKTRLRNEIQELDLQIASRQQIVRGKTVMPGDAETVSLREQRDERKKQFDEIFGTKELTDGQRLELAAKAIDRSIAEVERQLKSGEIFTPGKKAQLSAPELDAKRARLEALREERQYARDLLQPREVKSREDIALQSRKTYLKNREAELREKLASRDFSTKPRRAVTLDEVGNRLQANYERTKLEFERELMKEKLARRGTVEKTLSGIAKWNRAFVLTWPTILGKLTAASGELIALTPVEEAVGSGIRRIIPRVAEKAPRYGGGMNLKIEAGAIVHTLKTAIETSTQKLKTGQSDIDVTYGKPHVMPHELKDYILNLHGALKEPARQNEFWKSFQYRLEHASKNGADISDPLIQTKVGFEAYKDANRQIFMESNMLADGLERFLGRLAQQDKATGQPSWIGKAAETAIRTRIPVVRIPLNIVKRSFEYSFGTVAGGARLGRAMVRGLDNLQPEEADIIMRNLRRGSLGLAVVALGYFNPTAVGGYYQRGEKRDKKDVAVGALRIYGVDIPKILVHNPLLEQLQIGATIRRIVDSKLHKKDAETQGYTAGIMGAYGGLIEETPFVQQAEDSVKALNPSQRNQFLGELLKSLVPGVVQWAAQRLDTKNKTLTGETVKRKPTTPTQYLETAIPGLRKRVPEKKEK